MIKKYITIHSFLLRINNCYRKCHDSLSTRPNETNNLGFKMQNIQLKEIYLGLLRQLIK